MTTEPLLVCRCMFCNRVRDQDRVWHHPQESPDDVEPLFSHGLCDECRVRGEAELDPGESEPEQEAKAISHSAEGIRTLTAR